MVHSISDSFILRMSTIIGSTIDMLAWSSIIARPSIVRPVLGCVSWMGQVLLYEDAHKMFAWACFWRPGPGCQSRVYVVDIVSSGRHAKFLWWDMWHTSQGGMLAVHDL